MIYNAGLVLEGGGTRGAFSDGVLDRFMELDIEFKVMTGVSAGACNGASFKSRQKTRAFHALADFIEDDRYCGMKCFLKTGDVFGKQMVYYDVPERLLPFDNKTYMENPLVFYVVAANVKTGKPEYLRVDDGFKDIEKIRASASIPLLSKFVPLKMNADDGEDILRPGDDGLYLDGGIVDSIPLKFSERFFEKNVAILTRAENYVKTPQSSMQKVFTNFRYGRYPEFKEAMRRRHEMYNAEMNYVKKQEKAGKVFAIRPGEELTMGRVERDPKVLKAAYDMGYAEACRVESELLKFLDPVKQL